MMDHGAACASAMQSAVEGAVIYWFQRLFSLGRWTATVPFVDTPA